MGADRELLVLAAKAAGIALWPVDPWRDTGLSHWLLLEDGRTVWNPLTQDGDALRLACKLNMMIDYITKSTLAYKHGHVVAVSEAGSFYEFGFTDAATRRAIVRAAAEIGRAQ